MEDEEKFAIAWMAGIEELELLKDDEERMEMLKQDMKDEKWTEVSEFCRGLIMTAASGKNQDMTELEMINAVRDKL